MAIAPGEQHPAYAGLVCTGAASGLGDRRDEPQTSDNATDAVVDDRRGTCSGGSSARGVARDGWHERHLVPGLALRRRAQQCRRDAARRGERQHDLRANTRHGPRGRCACQPTSGPRPLAQASEVDHHEQPGRREGPLNRHAGALQSRWRGGKGHAAVPPVRVRRRDRACRALPDQPSPVAARYRALRQHRTMAGHPASAAATAWTPPEPARHVSCAPVRRSPFSGSLGGACCATASPRSASRPPKSAQGPAAPGPATSLAARARLRALVRCAVGRLAGHGSAPLMLAASDRPPAAAFPTTARPALRHVPAYAWRTGERRGAELWRAAVLVVAPRTASATSASRRAAADAGMPAHRWSRPVRDGDRLPSAYAERLMRAVARPSFPRRGARRSCGCCAWARCCTQHARRNFLLARACLQPG